MRLLIGVTLSLLAVACSSENTATSSSVGVGGSTSAGGSGGSAGSGGTAGPTWSQMGLEGSIVNYLAVDSQQPTTIFAGVSPGGTGAGFFRSTDGGATWPQAPGLPANEFAHGLAASPLEDIVIANPGVQGQSRSSDGGDTWSPVTSETGSAADILFHPTQSTVAWLTDGNTGVQASSDHGVTFVSTPNTGLPLGMESIGALASDGTTLYVSAGAQGVFASSDGGNSFTAANSGLPLGEIEGVVNTLAAHPSRPGFVLAETTARGLFRSDDSGVSWTMVDLGDEASRYPALAIDPADPMTLYVSHDDTGEHPGGLLQSTDGGASWSAIGPDGVDVVVLDFDPDTGALFAGTLGRGVWRYDD